MKIPRSVHKFIADTFGYFWMPCPVCSEPFGGHELKHSKSVQVLLPDGYSQRCVCNKADCIYEAGRMSVKSESGKGGYTDLSSGPKYREYGDMS